MNKNEIIINWYLRKIKKTPKLNEKSNFYDWFVNPLNVNSGRCCQSKRKKNSIKSMYK